MKKVKNVLFILPDPSQVQALTSLLERVGGYATRSVRMPAEFAGAIASFTPDLVVMNEQLPPDDMQAWARVITGLSPATLLLDLTTRSVALRRLELSAHGYLREPFRPAVFLQEVRRIFAAGPMTLLDV